MEQSEKKIPACIGIIMDGNRRYAREQGLETREGHRLGYMKAKEAAQWCREVGVKYLILYAFSNENWGRTPEEVEYLTEIFNTLIFSEAEEFRKENGAIRFIGDIARFGESFSREAHRLEHTNPKDPVATVVVALSYGGRQEIVGAINRLLKENKKEISVEEFGEYLETYGIPDPDLILRTSGEQRLSNFLPWQTTYSELFFVPQHWPAFTRDDFKKVLDEYAERERRHGK
jgi:undecaprenyl diphosphate synthase